LNLLVDNVNKPGGVLLNPDSPFSGTPAFTSGVSYGQMASAINDMSSGKTKTVIVYGANPVYSLPKASGFANALSKVSTIVSLSSFLDETTMQADIILPVHTTLEAWDIRVADPGPGYSAVVLQQPVVDPFVNSRSAGDIILQAAKAAGQSSPYNTYQDVVQAAIAELQKGGKGNIKESDPKAYLVQAQTQGGWWDDTTKGTAGSAAPKWPTAAAPKFAGDSGSYPMYLLPYPHNTLGYGEYSHLPWLQGAPEPISTNVWQTWVEVSQHDSDKIGLNTGDIVKVKTPRTTVELPVYVNPAGQPGVVAIPFGQGHTAYTRYAEKRGTNPLDLIDPLTDSETGALAWASTRVKLETTGKKMRLPRFEGQVPAFQLAGAPIVQVIPSE
ncbi:MAG TPA: molybdopterin dinucleotide binding domain-containing protein, partial [Thermomicrobiaceae bacterium]|nr:molybdopterin dinucleotide binding domain-containing protein [Thermomicrobiaceae bacterium]